MRLTQQEVLHIAHLARIALSDEEREMYAKQLSQILGFVEKLREVSTDQVPLTAQVTGLENVTREDVVVHCDSVSRRKIIDAFPEREGDLLKVKAIFKE